MQTNKISYTLKNYGFSIIPDRHNNTFKLWRYLIEKHGKFINGDSKIYASQATLAKNTKCNVRTIRRSLKELAQLKLITIIPRKFKTSLIYINWEYILKSTDNTALPAQSPVGQNVPQLSLPKGKEYSINTKAINTDLKRKSSERITKVKEYFPREHESIYKFLHKVAPGFEMKMMYVNTFIHYLKQMGIEELPRYKINYMFFANITQTLKLKQKYGDKFRPLGDRIASKESKKYVPFQDRSDYQAKIEQKRLQERAQEHIKGLAEESPKNGISHSLIFTNENREPTLFSEIKGSENNDWDYLEKMLASNLKSV
jgi:hypothetical protein